MFTDKTSGFLFERNNLQELCSLLRQLNNNEALLDAVSTEAIKEAREKFHPDSIAQKTYNFYLNVLQNTSK
jgi:glycosyltransferase involved in cell wall biosynthesis